MLSGGTAMLDMGEILKIDELARTLEYGAESVEKEELRAATCHIKQMAGPERSERAARAFLDAVGLCPEMPDAAQVQSVSRFLLELCGVEDDAQE